MEDLELGDEQIPIGYLLSGGVSFYVGLFLLPEGFLSDGRGTPPEAEGGDLGFAD